MKTLTLLASLACSALAVAPPASVKPQIMKGYIQPLGAVGIPTASEYLVAYGIWVAVHSEDVAVTSFLVTVRYRTANNPDVQCRNLLVANTNPKDWNYTTAWVGEPSVLVSVTASSQVVSGTVEEIEQ